MDRDDFIITVYCLVCDQYRALFHERPLRHGGFTPQLTDEEVITLEICGEYFNRYASSRAVAATAVSSLTPITGIARRKT